jgi:hypothetical protein
MDWLGASSRPVAIEKNDLSLDLKPRTSHSPVTQVQLDKTLPGSPRFTFGFNSAPGDRYQVLYRDDDFKTWTVADTLVAGANWTSWRETMSPGNIRFFRVIAAPQDKLTGSDQSK